MQLGKKANRHVKFEFFYTCKMEVIYNNSRYIVTKELLSQSKLLNFLCNETKHENSVRLTLFEDVFVDLLHNKLDYNKDLEYLHQALCYFDVERTPFYRYVAKLHSADKFFEKYIDKVNWDQLSRNTNLSEEFFEKHINKVNWVSISRNKNISDKFFEKYIDKVNWIWLSYNKNISEKFFEKYIKKVKWKELSKNSFIELIKKKAVYTFDKEWKRYLR